MDIRSPSLSRYYEIFMSTRLDWARNTMESGYFVGDREKVSGNTMPDFVPIRICPAYHFDIRRNRKGYWIVRDRCGLAGGTFVTRKDAVRFALFEAGGDRTHVHTYRNAKAASNDASADRRGVL